MDYPDHIARSKTLRLQASELIKPYTPGDPALNPDPMQPPRRAVGAGGQKNVPGAGRWALSQEEIRPRVEAVCARDRA